MNKRIKRLWVKALESGRYTQGHGALCNRHGDMCCLGVLATVQRARRATICYHAMLGGGLARFAAGLSPQQQNTLASMNDYDFKTFKEIAKHIRANL